VPLTVEWLHLDCIFAVIREGLCMCFLQGLRERRLPAPMEDWEVIEATAEEAHALGCNTLCLEPGMVIVGAEHRRLINEIESEAPAFFLFPSTHRRRLAVAFAARPTRSCVTFDRALAATSWTRRPRYHVGVRARHAIYASRRHECGRSQ